MNEIERSEGTEKKINIEGTGNRYLMKKVMKTEKIVQIKKDISNHETSPLQMKNLQKNLYILISREI